MYKTTTRIISIIILSSMLMTACSVATGNPGINQTPAAYSGSLTNQQKTAVASVVSSASTATQNAAGKTTNAGALTGTPAAPAGMKPGSNSGLATQANGTPASSGSASSNTGNSTVVSVAKTPDVTPGIMKPSMDWSGSWANLLKSIPDNYYTISVDELASKIEAGSPPFMLDVRDPSELTKYGYIKGAVNIPYGSVLSNLDKLPAMDKAIVVYSGVGHRGTIILSALRLLGYTQASMLEGGMSSWLSSKKPAEVGVPAAPTAGTMPKVDANKVKDLESFIATGTYGIEAVDLNNWLASSPKPIVLDVRERNETSTRGAIKGSVEISLKSLLDNLNILSSDKTSPIVVVDSSGHRAAMAMMALRMIGYTNVRSLFGGFDAWVAGGLPIVK